jgi:hypothetical protein
VRAEVLCTLILPVSLGSGVDSDSYTKQRNIKHFISFYVYISAQDDFGSPVYIG